jgi:hypothetical protein
VSWRNTKPARAPRTQFPPSSRQHIRDKYPEIIVFGLPLDRCAGIVNEIGTAVRSGKRFTAETQYADILREPRKCRFRKVPKHSLSRVRGFMPCGSMQEIHSRCVSVSGQTSRGTFLGTTVATSTCEMSSRYYSRNRFKSQKLDPRIRHLSSRVVRNSHSFPLDVLH